jgi:hypothetical protein
MRLVPYVNRLFVICVWNPKNVYNDLSLECDVIL